MFDSNIILLSFALYMGVLFALAIWVERKLAGGKNYANNPWIYSLSLAIYCTSWTYYGSVGKAATSGLLFLTIYIGPTLMVMLGWFVFRKLVRLKVEYKITNVPDLLSARYGKSQALATMATLLTIIAVSPYIALQLKSIFETLTIITASDAGTGYDRWAIDMLIVLITIVFTNLFGVRHIDPTERHPSMVVAVAMESVVKLTAFVAAGIFVTYFLFDGLGDIFDKLSQISDAQMHQADMSGQVPYIQWASYLIVSMSAVIFLPRQFHVAIVENYNERHIRTAMWLFPIYLLVINFFVYPIAMGGLILGEPIQAADTFVLKLPLSSGHRWLSMFVFIGGFSAAISMIMVCAMTMATMVTNHLLLPLIDLVRPLSFIKKRLLESRWVAVAAIIMLGYWFERQLGESSMLVSMGMISFVGILQFAPAIVGGIYWSKGNKKGAFWGIIAGFSIWFYTLLVPSFVKSGWVSEDIMHSGPLGLSLLRPEQFLGVSGLDNISHAVFWSLLLNCGAYCLASLYTRQSDEEYHIAREFVEVFRKVAVTTRLSVKQGNINLAEKIDAFILVLREYLPNAQAEHVINEALSKLNLHGVEFISIADLAQLYNVIETNLAGAIGVASAHKAMEHSRIINYSQAKELSELFEEVMVLLKLTPEEAKVIKAEAALRDSEERYRKLIEEISEGLIMTTSDGCLSFYNHRFSDMLGYSDDNIMGKPLIEFVNQENHNVYNKRVEQSKNGVKGSYELSWVKKDGNNLFSLVSETPILDEFNNYQGSLALISDITEHKILESQLLQSQKLESIGQLAAGIAHEINTPTQYVSDNTRFLRDAFGDITKAVTSYLALAQLLKDQTSADPTVVQALEQAEAIYEDIDGDYILEEVPKAIEQTLEGLNHIATIVRSMKEFAHPGSESKTPADINRAIENTITVAKNEWKYVAEVVTELDPDLPLVPCVLGEVNQVFLNIIVNAAYAIADMRKESDGPKGQIKISTRRVGEEVEIRIVDSGPGIPVGLLNRIFDPFFTTKPPGKGTGQGLAIAYRVVVDKHGGHLSVENLPGQGACFVIRLPLEEAGTQEGRDG